MDADLLELEVADVLRTVRRHGDDYNARLRSLESSVLAGPVRSLDGRLLDVERPWLDAGELWSFVAVPVIYGRMTSGHGFAAAYSRTEVVDFCEKVEADRGAFFVDLVWNHGSNDQGGAHGRPTTSNGCLTSWEDKGTHLLVRGVTSLPDACAGHAVSWAVARCADTKRLVEWRELSILPWGGRPGMPGAAIDSRCQVTPERVAEVQRDTRAVLDRLAA